MPTESNLPPKALCSHGESFLPLMPFAGSCGLKTHLGTAGQLTQTVKLISVYYSVIHVSITYFDSSLQERDCNCQA